MAHPLEQVDPNCPGCAALLALLHEQHAVFDQQQTVVDRQQAAITSLEARVAELEERLGTDSSNSSQPPSQDPPASRQDRRKRTGSGRRRGGQAGHKRHKRDLLPPEQVDHLRAVRPLTCLCCGETLSGTDDAPHRHQVTELPPIQPVVTEYQLHALSCTTCGKVSRAELPDGVPTGAFGPRLQALVSTLTAHYRLSKQKTQELLADVLGIRISTGAISKLEAKTSSALEQPTEQAFDYVLTAEQVNIDETSWQQEGKTHWLWVVVTTAVALFVVRPSRKKTVARQLLGDDVSGIVTTDRYAAYHWLHRLHRQLCWAHLIRDFRKMATVKDAAAAAIGEQLGQKAQELFVLWHRLRAGTLRRSSFRTYASQIRVSMRQLLHRGAELSHDKVSGMCRAMLKLEPSMWTFVRVEGIEPTNNAAERELRHGVLYRKISSGTQSERGSRFVERMLTVRGTLRRQERNVFEFLVAACTAQLEGHTPPSLLPEEALTV